MRVLIVEDEELAARELESILNQIDGSIVVLEKIQSIASAVEWFKLNSADLVFMDIHLGDGESFEIFEQVDVTSPVIFTTAFDQYTLKAFKNQGIDYILKPFDVEDIRQSLKKVRALTSQPPLVQPPFNIAGTLVKERKRFMVNLGSRIKMVSAEEIAYFMAEGKYLYLFTSEGLGYIIDETITSIEPQLSPADFFRINRKFIVHIRSIGEMVKLSRNRIKIFLNPPPPNEVSVIVSEDRAEPFRSWLNY